MTASGLLMETETQNPENPVEKRVLTQFVHLSIQECLAMAGLLQEPHEKVKDTIRQLAGSQQYNMALLFVYGLAFDVDDGPISELASVMKGLSENRIQMKEVLLKEVGVRIFNS